MNLILLSFSNHFRTGFFISPNKTLLLTNSGGQDSTVLFLLFFILQKQYKYNLITIYCNHLWQVSSLQLIIQLSRTNFAQKINLIILTPFFNLKNENISRNWRYSILTRFSCFSSFEYIIVGHTSTDQIESFILNICRGAGSLGLTTLKREKINFFTKFICFSEKKQKISFFSKLLINQLVSNSIWSIIYRPLFTFNRFEVYQFYSVLNLPIWTDQTNFNLTYRRNRIRLELLPYLRFYLNPNVDVALLRCIQNISSESTFLKKLTLKTVTFNSYSTHNLSDQLIIYNYSQFIKYPYIVQTSSIISTLIKLKLKCINYNFIHLFLKFLFLIKNQIKESNPQVFYISNKIIFGFYGNYIYICKMKNGSDGI